MTRSRWILALALVLACGLPAVAGESGKHRLQKQKSPVFDLADFSEVPRASSMVIRGQKSVLWFLKTRKLPPGDAVTVWFCGWNDPSLCGEGAGSCGVDPADLAEDFPGSFCWWEAGGIVNRRGEFASAGVARANKPSGDVWFGNFEKVREAELNIAVRTHGKPIPGRLHEQITTYAGGCDVNECIDLQVAIFPAP